jgi:hypothetical protein
MVKTIKNLTMNLFKKNLAEKGKKVISKVEKIRRAQSNNVTVISNIVKKTSVLFQNNDKFQASCQNLIDASKRYNRALALFHFNLIKAIYKNSKKNY